MTLPTLMARHASLSDVLETGAVTSLLQPIVDLYSGAVVAYEALARGPRGPLHAPDVLFEAARSQGLLAGLDALCRRTAVRTGIAAGVLAPQWLFVNVEPEVLDAAGLDELLDIARQASGELRVVLEITERALSLRPAELLGAVERVRAAGWKVALDDVGADDMSLAFMSLLRPEVVKLDLRLIQERPGPEVAAIVHAVGRYAQDSGAVVVAEGIEDESHVHTARSLGARLGQGWRFGRPQDGRVAELPVGHLSLPTVPVHDWRLVSPFACLPPGTTLRRSAKPLLIQMSKHLERQAATYGSTCVVVSTFQDAQFFTPATRARYTALAQKVAFVAALGEGLPAEPAPGVRGAQIAGDDPLRGEWDVVVLSPHFAAALLARDLGETGTDAERGFEFALTYDREAVVNAAQALLSRVAPRSTPASMPIHPPVWDTAGPSPAALAVAAYGPSTDLLLQRALAATTSGISISDFNDPDQPLVYVNSAFERLSGSRAEEVLGHNCRFLQGQGTDLDTVRRMREGIAAGAEVRETVLNYRADDGEPWWNEIYLAPVHDEQGRLVQYIGVQSDVTKRIRGEEALRVERQKTVDTLRQLEIAAYTDSLTGLLNRRRVTELLEDTLAGCSTTSQSAAVLYIDLDRFKAVNDEHGHAVGDDLLREVGRHIASRLRAGDLLARLGGDEFLAILPGLEPAEAGQHARRVASALGQGLGGGVRTRVGLLPVHASVGISLFPQDGDGFDALVHAADARMYRAKRRDWLAG